MSNPEFNFEPMKNKQKFMEFIFHLLTSLEIDSSDIEKISVLEKSKIT